jgi:hypothetical protein
MHCANTPSSSLTFGWRSTSETHFDFLVACCMTATLALDQLTAIMITLKRVQQSLALTHSHNSYVRFSRRACPAHAQYPVVTSLTRKCSTFRGSPYCSTGGLTSSRITLEGQGGGCPNKRATRFAKPQQSRCVRAVAINIHACGMHIIVHHHMFKLCV